MVIDHAIYVNPPQKYHSASREWLPFEKARTYARALGLNSSKEWFAYCKSGQRPYNIPSNPWEIYKAQWQSMGNWLGKHSNRPFEDAREYARSLGLKSKRAWFAYCKSVDKPDNIPTYPYQVYKDQWVSWGNWLGTGTIFYHNREWLPFEEARAYVQTLGLKSWSDWYAHSKSKQLPKNIPSAPNKIYKTQWQGMGDWLGTR